MKAYLKKPHLLKKLQQAILLTLVFLLASEPLLVAAQEPIPQQRAAHVGTIIGSIGDILELIPGLQATGGASFVGDAAATILKTLCKTADDAFKAVLKFLELEDAFKVAIELISTAVKPVLHALGGTLDEVFTVLRDVFTGGLKLWDNFKVLCIRLEWKLIVELGINDGSLFLGRVINSGADIVGDAGKLRAVKLIGDDLIAAGVNLSDEAVEGLGKFAKELGKDDLPKLMKELGTDPALTDKVLASYKLFNANMLAGSGKIANAIGPENLGKLLLKYANDPAKVVDVGSDASKIFGDLGKAITPNNAERMAEAIRRAFQNGEKAADAGGPEAVRALAGWSGQPPNDLLTNVFFVEELAERAGTDAVALKKLQELLNLGPLNYNDPIVKQLIKEIAANSAHGRGNVFVLGIFSDYDSGYVLYGRYLERAEDGSRYFHSHPEIYNRVLNRFLTDPVAKEKLLWAINEQALNIPIGSRMPFEYSLFDAVGDKTTVEEIWNKGKELKAIGASNDVIETEFDKIIMREYNKIPGRMKELKLLFFNGYANLTFDAGSSAFKITP